MTGPDTGAERASRATAGPMPGGIFGRIVEALSAIGTIWILALMVLICADVGGRALLSRPIAGVPEMVQFSIVGIVFLQLAQTLRTGGLTRSDVMLGALMRRRPRAASLLEALFALTGFALFAVILATTWPLMLAARADGDFFGNVGVFQLAVWPLKLIIVIGGVATAAQFLLLSWQGLRVALGLEPPPGGAEPAG